MFCFLIQKNRFYHPAIDVYQACQVTIHYTKDSSSSKTDQILIKQKQNNDGQTIIVYKGYLKSDGQFFIGDFILKKKSFFC